MKKLILLSFSCLLSLSALAQETNVSPMSEKEFEQLMFSDKKLRFSEQERQAIAIANKWRNAEYAPEPVTGRDGSVSFLYGAGQVSIMCAVLQVCDLQLQAGEIINQGGIHLGDNRWQIQPAITGVGQNKIVHVILKPLDVGLDTTLILATNRRTYNIRLRSDRKEFMPKVTFAYPEDAMQKFYALQGVQVEREREITIPQTKERLTDLDFNYAVRGEAQWKPLRVYNDGVKTIIQMPKIMQQTEAPTLLVIRENDGLWSKDEEVLVNYRILDDRFIVDNIFNKAILITGVGRNQTKVTIERDIDGSATNGTFHRTGARK